MTKYNEKLIQLETAQMKHSAEMRGIITENNEKHNAKQMEMQKQIEEKFTGTIKALEEKVAALSAKVAEKDKANAMAMLARPEKNAFEIDLEERLDRVEATMTREFDLIK